MTLLAEITLVVIAAVGVAVCFWLLPKGPSTSWQRASARAQSRPDQLVRLERLVVTSGATAIEAHAYLRPVLAEIASERLAARGQTLKAMPDSVGKTLLGEPLWEIVRPDRPFPENRHGPGVSQTDLRAMLDVLERL